MLFLGKSPWRARTLRKPVRFTFLLFAVFNFGLGINDVRAFAQSLGSKLKGFQSGYYRLTIGDVEVIALSDGTIPFPAYGNLLNTHQVNVDALLDAADAGAPLEASMNAYLIHLGNRLILVDAGAGQLLGPTLDKLPMSLSAAGYTPAQITDILLTHIHADHSGGLMDGEHIRYPNATVHVEKRELDFWLSPAEMERAAPENKPYFAQARKTVQPYVSSGQVKTFAEDAELFEGLQAVHAHGHTPGHTFYVLSSRGEKLVFMGDVVHAPEVQFAEPDIAVTFDIDPVQAIATREAAFREAARDHFLVAFAHVSFPGVGHIHAEGGHYRWNPVAFVNDAVR